MRNDKTYLAHIHEAIDSVEKYLHGVTYDEFMSNKMIIDAVVRELEIIGEASNKLSEKFRKRHSDILWQRMKNMRNFLIHEYFGINNKIVWDTCKNDLPQLKQFVIDLLNKNDLE